MTVLRTAVLLLAAAPLLGACIVIDAGEDSGPKLRASAAARNEPIYGAWFDEAGFNVRIPSNGCTDKDNVRVDVDHYDRGVEVEVERIRPDHCKALVREGVVLTWSLEELGVDRTASVAVQNGMVPW